MVTAMRGQARAGFTLIELAISLTMLSIVLTAMIGTMLSMQRGYVRQREVARTEDALRHAELTITSILRSGAANPRNIAGPRIDPLALIPPFTSLRVVSDYNPVDADVDDPLEDVQVWAATDTLFVRWQVGQPAAPVAFPVRSLLFAYDSNGVALITSANVARAATRVRVTLTAPRHSKTNVLARRDTWVYLRNR
jgi:prepilin-type N-terminal cleavage/methylation domain-containing protein